VCCCIRARRLGTNVLTVSGSPKLETAALDLIAILRRKTLGRDKGDLLCLAGNIARQRADRIRAELTGGGGVQQASANGPTTYD
jgi:hypothetical protein